MIRGFQRARRALSSGSGALQARRGQQGVSLLLALVFVTFLGAVLVSIVRFNNFEVRRAEASVAGWELVEIGKAARLYMRDAYVANPALRTAAATPSIISLDTLRSSGYLSATIVRKNTSNQDLSALNQRIYVIMTNWSPTGLGGGTTDPATVPSAFVYFAPGGKSTHDLVLNIVESARKHGANITAPLYDSAGTNRSAVCRGAGAAIGLWDTGCLTLAEFNAIAGAAGISPATFGAGGIIMPAWKSVQLDLRAVMRFPQPENPGYATMLTDLEMGVPLSDNCTNPAQQVTITTANSAGALLSTPTGVCDVHDDAAATGDAVANNRRFNILNAANIMAERVVAEPQAVDYGGETMPSQIGNANMDALRIEGNLRMASDLRVYNVRALAAGVTHRFEVRNGTLAVERNSYLYSNDPLQRGHARVGTIVTARQLITDDLTTPRFTSRDASTVNAATQPQISVTTRTDILGTVSVPPPASGGTADSQFITETMRARHAQVMATDNTGQVQVTDTLSMGNGMMTVSNSGVAATAGNYTAVIGEMRGMANTTADNSLRFMNTTSGALEVGSTGGYTSGSRMPLLESYGTCNEDRILAGGCPDRQYTPPNITF